MRRARPVDVVRSRHSVCVRARWPDGHVATGVSRVSTFGRITGRGRASPLDTSTDGEQRVVAGMGHPADMRIRYWGTRGSIATPGPSTVRYGGNTSCVELRSSRGTLIVFDCGTGARVLGRALVEQTRPGGDPVTGSILLGHTHWDHIQGLPFFEPLFGGGHWDVYGPRGLDVSLDQTLAGQMNYQYFPVALDQVGAEVAFHELVEGTFEIGDLVVRTQYLNHPALTLGYRVECDGAVVCYVTDHEPFDPALGRGGDVSANGDDARHVEFLEGADVIIHDAQYDASEYSARVGWGHSPMEYVVDVASAAGVRRTVLFHHDPSHDDATVEALVERANVRATGRTQVVAAAEGDMLDVSPSSSPRSPHRARSASATPALDELTVSIVIISGDRALRRVVEDAARAEKLPVVDASDAVGPVDQGGRLVVVVDVDDDGGGLDRLRSAITPSAWARLWIVAVDASAHRCASRSRRYVRLAGLAGNRGARSNEAARSGAPAGVPVARRTAAARRGDPPQRAPRAGPSRHRRRGPLRPFHRASLPAVRCADRAHHVRRP